MIIFLVPRSQIDAHRAEYQEQEAAIHQPIAQGLGEERALDVLEPVTVPGVPNLMEKSRFLSERPGIIENRS